jgi:nitrate reductase assembly molybdenum cofactor insertion protein NarJ
MTDNWIDKLFENEEDILEYLNELQDAINSNSIYKTKVYLRILLKRMGMSRNNYRELIEDIAKTHKAYPDLDT